MKNKKTLAMGVLIGSLFGGVLSAAAALLMAPRAGKDTRRMIKSRLREAQLETERRLMEKRLTVVNRFQNAQKDMKYWVDRRSASMESSLKKARASVHPPVIAGNAVERILDR